MPNTTLSPFSIIAIFLLLLLCNGCAAQKAPLLPPVPAGEPGILDDPVFLDALKHSGAKGLAGIRIVAPASGVSEEEIEKVHAMAKQLGVDLPRRSLDPASVPYNAQNDSTRLALFADALGDPDVEVIWALKGGYGAGRLLPELDKLENIRPKIFIGYSDMTFLHLFLRDRGWRTVHGGMFLEMDNPAKDKANFRLLADLLAGKMTELRYNGLRPFNKAARQQRKALEGVLTGGNLACLASAAGTPWALRGAGKILFMEDVTEPGYRIDRMLTQLLHSGALDEVKAVLLGEFTGGDDNNEFALRRFADTFDKPVFRSDLFGHGRKNYPLVFNSPAVIQSDGNEQNGFVLIIPVRCLP